MLFSPSKCRKKPDRKLVIFGIKSMPKSTGRRAAIRRTWLDQTNWNPFDVDIKVLFIVGRGEISDEVAQFGDILQLDFAESHYKLPAKDNAYFS